MDSFFHRRKKPDAGGGDLAAVQARADEGDVGAQLLLGLRYGKTPGNAADLVQAAHWYRLAADQNCALAQYHLGVMFARGHGVIQDDTLAADWLRKAAESGEAGGQHEFGMLCHRACLDGLRTGREESRIEAYKWLHLAAEQGHNGSTAAWELVTMSMTRAEITEGNRRVAAFVARSSPVSDPT